MTVRAIEWDPATDRLRLLDQTKLPGESVHLDIKSVDALVDAIDYDAVSSQVVSWIESRQAQLIETLAEGVAQLVRERFSVPWVKVSIWKPGAVPAARRVGVTIVRGNPI